MKAEDEIHNIVFDITKHLEEIKIQSERLKEESYDRGISDAMEEYEIPDTEEEKIGVNYVVHQFKDCKTLEDFQRKYKEIEIISFTHL